MGKRVQIFFDDPSLTKQSFKDQCDVNQIVERYRRDNGGELLQMMQGYAGGQFGDFSNVVDYRSALDQINAAKGVFDALPAIVRKRFDNDPAIFLDFCDDPQNHDELVRMGFAEPRKAEAVKPETEGVSS